jgi:membrane protease subunit HflK
MVPSFSIRRLGVAPHKSSRLAGAYREQTVAEAIGQTARFNKIYEEYRKAPEVTRATEFESGSGVS